MIYFGTGGPAVELSYQELKLGLETALDRVGRCRKVLIIPPDMTRIHSQAGKLTAMAHGYYASALTDILPALGTHYPMNSEEITEMFPGVPLSLFREHNWRDDLVTLGTVPGDFVREVSDGKLDFDWPAQVNSLLTTGGFDLILSIGQVVPHEVIGMANYNKNIFVGTGGREGINKSHYLGAVYGMERIMGRTDTPVRRVLNYASENFAKHLPIVYVQTVVSKGDDGGLKVRGLFIGDDIECFLKASELSLRVNFDMLSKPIEKAVVYLDPSEFKSTWLGNKSIYRTRMAIADGGSLTVLAPGVSTFGEDPVIDRLVRAHGYRGTGKVLQTVAENEELRQNLGTAAHLIHGSSEGRFSITYCPGGLTRDEIEGVGYRYEPYAETIRKYNPRLLRDGYNTLHGGEEIFYISNPALGLWAVRERFDG